jgi:hypothetical protein
LLLTICAWAIILAALREIAKPWFEDVTKWGWHDWDFSTMTRWVTVHTIKKFHQFPFWNPYTCGGHTTWGYVEADTTLISPWLPLYLLAPVPIALRIEVLGTCLFGALGTWLLVGRFTRSIAARAFVAVIFALNGRFALQAAAGHLWHSYYAYMPWVLYFYDRAQQRGGWDGRWTHAIGSGAFLALMVYQGAVYPLPHTILCLALYGSLLALFGWTLRPLWTGLLAGATAFGLAAPKLLPISEFFSRTPRYFDSPEHMGFDAMLAMLTSKDQDFMSRPAPVSHWGWHEWGMYIGWVPMVVLIFTTLVVWDRRALALKIIGVLFVALSFGAFDRRAPWTLLHELPVFASQHVPSRWLYPAALVLGLITAIGVGKVYRRLGPTAAVIADAALMVLVFYVAMDIAPISALPMKRVFWMQLPKIQTESVFHQEKDVPASLHYVVSDWVQPALPAMMSNVGVIQCYGVAGLSIWSANEQGVIPGLGAKGRGEPGYHGEVYTASGSGRPTIVSFTPNKIVVAIDDGVAGDTLVLNQNYYAGWRVDGHKVINYHDTLGVPLRGGRETLTFRCWAPGLTAGIVIFILTVGALAAAAVISSRKLRAR